MFTSKLSSFVPSARTLIYAAGLIAVGAGIIAEAEADTAAEADTYQPTEYDFIMSHYCDPVMGYPTIFQTTEVDGNIHIETTEEGPDWTDYHVEYSYNPTTGDCHAIDLHPLPPILGDDI